MPPETCPNCGADVPRHARACPECGADERTGWSDRTDADGLDLPDGEFNYDEFVEKEFGRSPKPTGLPWFWWVVAIAALLAFLALFVFRR